MRSKKKTIYDNILVFLLLFFPFLRPLGITIPFANAWLFVSMACSLIIAILNINVFLRDRTCLLFGFYFLSIILITLFKVGIPTEGLQKTFSSPCGFILAYIWCKKNKRVLIEGGSIILTFELLVTTIEAAISGFSGMTFMGIRTIFHLMLPTCFFFGHFVRQYESKFDKLMGTLLFLLPAFISLFYRVSTAVLSFAAFVGVFIVFAIDKKRKTISNPVFLLLIGIILNYLVVFVRIQDHFEYLLTNVLRESMTLDGRTIIWDNAMPLVKQSLFFGYGIYGVRVDMGQYWNDISFNYIHSQSLQLLLDGGLVSLLVFVLAFLSLCRSLKRDLNTTKSMFLCAVIFSLLIGMIAEVPTHYQVFYILLGSVASFTGEQSALFDVKNISHVYRGDNDGNKTINA